jgi:glutathione S-transferase
VSIVLHDFVLDADCYKVRLMLSLLGLRYETVAVDVFPGREQTGSAFLRLNPRGRVPVLVDGGHVLCEAEAILAYLARRYDPMDHWLPADDPALFGEAMGWMLFAADALRPATLARRAAMFEVAADGADNVRAARAAFRIMEDHMTARGIDGGAWFVGPVPTVADVALFPAIALSRDAGIEHDAYPALRRWMRRVRSLPGFATMPGIPDYH